MRARIALLLPLILIVAPVATAEMVTAYCEIRGNFGVYTYSAVAGAVFGIGEVREGCDGAGCDYHYDYLIASVTIDGTQLGTWHDSFSGFVNNPANAGCFPLYCPPGPSEISYSIDFDLPLPTYAGCAGGSLEVVGANLNSGYNRATSDAGQAICWQKTLCRLTVGVNQGALLPNTPNGLYQCSDCVSLMAMPIDPDYCFSDWSGDVNSSDQGINFCFGQEDKSVTATFLYCGCDPVLDPQCECDPNFDPSCDPGWVPPNPGNPPNSPLVVNFEHGNYSLTGKDDPVLFDIAASGTPVRIGWTAAGADVAFLCLDLNKNGKIDDGAELFGTATRLDNGLAAPNGFSALAEYDANHDNVINERDAVWSKLLLWRDSNHDGISQPAELTPVTASRLVAVYLRYHWAGRRDPLGNTYRYKALVWITDGSNVMARPVYDVFFVSVP